MNFFLAEDQSQIFFRDMGEGSPVILIHGWPLNGDMFEYQTLELLRKGFRVITYDRRGFGRSEHSATGYDYNTFSDDLAALIDHLDLKKVSLVGFSMGGGEIARYISRHGSEKVASVAFIAAVTPYLLKDNSNPKGVEQRAFMQMISQIEEDRPAFLGQFIKPFFGINLVQNPVSQETQNWCFSMAMAASLKATIDCVTAFSCTDFRDDMAAIDVPTLIIHGTEDKVVPLAVAGEASSRLLPHAIFKRYEGAPHGLFITHKHKLNADLQTFLDANRGISTDRVSDLEDDGSELANDENRLDRSRPSQWQNH